MNPLMQMGQQVMGQPLAGQQDPRSQYLAQALQQMGQDPNANRTPAALGENLMADALGKYGLQRRRNQLGNAGKLDAGDLTTLLDPNSLPKFPMIGNG